MARYTIFTNSGNSMENLTRCWELSKDAIAKYMNHPFYVQMANGTLSPTAFRRYLEQDSLYVVQYARAMCLLAYRTPLPSDSAMLMKLTVDNFAIEKGLLDKLSNEFGIESNDFSWIEGCHHYANHLLQMVETQPIEIAAAALLPCYWVYHENGLRLYRTATVENNPYAEWIKTYSGESFVGQLELIQEYVERQAKMATPTIRLKMADAFKEAVEHEILFMDTVMDAF